MIFGLSLWPWQTIQDIDMYGIAVQNLIRWSVGGQAAKVCPVQLGKGRCMAGAPPHTIINFISVYTNICLDLTPFEIDKYGTTTWPQS